MSAYERFYRPMKRFLGIIFFKFYPKQSNYLAGKQITSM